MRRALDANGQSDTPIKSISTKAAEWLKSLSGDALEKADVFLGEKYQTDVDSLAVALDNFESNKEVIVKDLSRELLNIEANFGADVNLKEIILSTVKDLCEGKDAPFNGMLILFDELGVYADRWCHHPTASGGFAPQEIFEACSDRPGKICFVGFVQRVLSEFVKRYSDDVQTEFKKWAGRIQSDAVYLLISNLEEVISKLLKKNAEWTRVIGDFAPGLRAESDLARESVKRYHENETWDANHFYNTVTRDCFPLHPLTTGLLCSFDFTQGSRTIIGAVDSMLRSAQENPVSDGGRLNWIRPIELVEEFKNDFDDSSDFAALENALEKSLTTDAEPILVDVLKALFLFRETKMTKQNKYEHAELLAHLAGYTLAETRDALDKLQNNFDAVRYSAERREYEFTGIMSGRGIVLDMAKSAIVGKRVDSFVKSLERLEAFKTLETGDTFNPQNNSQAREFKDEFAVKGDEWFLASRYLDAARLSIDEVKKLCKQTIDDGEARGTVIYLISGSSAELDEARDKAEIIFRKLKEENYAHPFVIAVPTEAATKLEAQILRKEYITGGMSKAQRDHFAESHQAALSFTNKELNDELIGHLRSVEYVVPNELSLKFNNRQKPLDEIADALFTNAYKFRAPSNSDSMKSTAGNTPIAEIARQLIINDLNFDSFNTAKQNIINHVLKEGNNKWEILDAHNKIQKPKNPYVLQAWNFLDKNISKTEWTTFAKLLSNLMQPPYGYDEYTATFLIAAWIGKHKHELAFKDSRKTQPFRKVGDLPQAGTQANLKLSELQNNLNKSKEFIKYLRASVAVQNSGHQIQEDAKKYLEQLRTVTDISEGEQLLEQHEQVLQTLASGDDLISQINETWENLKKVIDDAKRGEKDLARFRQDAENTDDLSNLLHRKTLLDIFGKQNGIQSSKAFVNTLKLVEDKIETLAKRDSQIVLPRIESYEAVHDKLDKSRQALNQAGRADLEKLFVAALELVEKEYRRLQTEAGEKPLLNEISAVQINGISLFNLSENLTRIEQILENSTSENIEKTARIKQKQLNEQLKNLRAFVKNLPAQINAVKDIGAGEDLRTKIYQNQNKYDGSPEAETIAESLEKLTARIDELKATRKRQIEEENERRRRELENLTAQSIAKEFQKITDSDQRFNCLVEMLHSAKSKGLTDEQTRTLQGLLN